MTWTELDWNALDRLRKRFLEGRPCGEPYWTSRGDLANYDLTFGERIGWKWDAVLDELVLRGWAPPEATEVLDWGCGSGIAGRRLIRRFGPGRFRSLRVWDHSAVACDFASYEAEALFPGLNVSVASSEFLRSSEPIGLLVISHVLNELEPTALEELRALASRSPALVWVEAGNRETSRHLGQLRDAWLADFKMVAPCTHSHPCPALQAGNERHWCHHFAAPPPFVFADSNWTKFGQRAGIDLRSLPYAFVALDRAWKPDQTDLSRVIGRPESFKPYTRLLNCDASGLAELTAMKRDHAALCKDLERNKGPLVYRWRRRGATIDASLEMDRGSGDAP